LRPIYNPTKKKIMKHNFQNNLILKDKIKKKKQNNILMNNILWV